MSAPNPRMPQAFATGTLSGITAVQPMPGASLPGTITLKSSAAGRKIELSTDGGTEYFTPSYDTTTTTMLVLTITAPVSHVRFTGVANDTWSVR